MEKRRRQLEIDVAFERRRRKPQRDSRSGAAGGNVESSADAPREPFQQVEAEASAFHGVAHADAVVLDEQEEVGAFPREVDENHTTFLVGECVLERIW